MMKANNRSDSSMSSSAATWLLIWLGNTISLTLFSKAVFQFVDFKYPYFLSAVHMVVSWMGAEGIVLCSSNHRDNIVTRVLGSIQHQKLDASSRYYMLAYSFIFSLNIAMGNVSLKHVSVNFNQVMRSLSPAVTMAISVACFGKRFSALRQWATVPVMVGVALACLGDMSNTRIGVFYTIVCVITAAAKSVASGELLTGSLKLHPVDLLARMAPLACAQCLGMAYLTGEITEITQRWSTELNPLVNVRPLLVVLFSAMAAFGLNISSLQTNKLTSPLTMSIAANVKQVLVMVLSTFLFDVQVSPLNGLGMGITLAASAWYSHVSLTEKQEQFEADESEYEPLKLSKGHGEDDDTDRTSDDDSDETSNDGFETASLRFSELA